jgi:hypothetical protein
MIRPGAQEVGLMQGYDSFESGDALRQLRKEILHGDWT